MSFSMTIRRPMCLFNYWTHAREKERSREKETEQENDRGVMWWILMKTHSARTAKAHACGNANYITWDDSSLERSHTTTRTHACRTIATDLEGCGKNNTNRLSIQHKSHAQCAHPPHPSQQHCPPQRVYAKAVSYQHPPNAISKTHTFDIILSIIHLQHVMLFTLVMQIIEFEYESTVRYKDAWLWSVVTVMERIPKSAYVSLC